VHTVTKIKKVTAGSTPEVGQAVDALYRSIIVAGTHLAPSIAGGRSRQGHRKLAARHQHRLRQRTLADFRAHGHRYAGVLEAAGTKWNFLPFRPGLVGGHCIGVDPYYLTHKAESLGYHPEIILAGRRLNDNMGAHVASRVVKLMIQKGQRIQGARVLVLGITFKENCPDIRNSHVVDVIRELGEFGCSVAVHDPWAEAEVRHEYGLELLADPFAEPAFDAVVLAVAHEKFKNLDFSRFQREHAVLFRHQGLLDRDLVDGRL
jgi:UDP-N-acetyl-D-glucosamine/UDP-N-acetyl-D-galactosamine dehydrogenase